MDSFRSHRQKRISKRQEQSAAEDIGGRTVAGSGAARHSGGGDVRNQGLLRLECKYTEQRYYVLSLADLTKIKMEALKGGIETPVLQIDFVSKHSGGHDLYAVRGHWGKDRGHILSSTDRKRIKIHQDDLQRSILHNNKTCIIFVRGTGRSEDVYEILPWGRFVDEWNAQQEEEC